MTQVGFVIGRFICIEEIMNYSAAAAGCEGVSEETKIKMFGSLIAPTHYTGSLPLAVHLWTTTSNSLAYDVNYCPRARAN